MTPQHGQRLAGILFMAAGAGFFVAAALAAQMAFFGVGVALAGVGIAFLVQTKQGG